MKSIELRAIPVERTSSQPGDLEGPTHLSVSISYNDGKLGSCARGYYLEVRPQIHDGNFVTTVAGRNKAHTLHKHLITNAKRFSSKTLAALASDSEIAQLSSALVEAAFVNNGLQAVAQCKAA